MWFSSRSQIKNLSHKYEGYLGNTYSNCLRIAVIRGYAHYGLDANEYVAKPGSRRNYPEEIVIEPDCNLPDLPPQPIDDDIVNLEGTPVTAEPSTLNTR